jgi:hypothetical protein
MLLPILQNWFVFAPAVPFLRGQASSVDAGLIRAPVGEDAQVEFAGFEACLVQVGSVVEHVDGLDPVRFGIVVATTGHQDRAFGRWRLWGLR